MRAFIQAFVAIGFLSTQVHAVDSIMRLPESKAPPPVSDEVMKSFRSDLQSVRADIMAKNLTLTSDQAAKFWPAYAKFQGEQNAITDPQLKTVQNYVNGYATLDDETALALVDANLTRDLEMNKLRRKWLAEFKKILPAKMAARVIQIDRRLGLAGQMEISSRIPLIH